MARPRTPRAKAAVEASDKKNPQRFKNRTDAKADGPLGNPPAWLKDTPELKAKAAWKAANIQGRIMAGQEVGVQAMNLLRQMLGQMGATPADASKVATGDDGDEKDDLLD
jgi:hypothetical protein